MQNSPRFYKQNILSIGSLLFFAAAFFVFATGPRAQANARVVQKNTSINLTTNFPEQVKKPKFWLSGRTAPDATLEFFIDGQSQGFLYVRHNGKFRKRFSLAIGQHTLRLDAASPNGTNSISGDVTRMAARAYDMPLGLDIIHSCNETTKNILSFYGSAYGVDKVHVSVNGEGWGYIVVKKKSGHYETTIRLSDGDNEIAVTATKGIETVTATKIVTKR